jgi:transglutaminase-like putative cysteine protease
MKLKIDHLTKYQYGEVVPLNTHEIYLTPLQRNNFSTLKTSMEIFPKPDGIYERLNAEGNPFQQVWFTEETDLLKIRSVIEVEIGTFNPFGFILQPGLKFPFDYFQYPSKYHDPLFSYLKTDPNSEFADFVKSVMSRSDYLISFLVDLVAEIHSGWKHIIREEEGLMTGMNVFQQKQGSCRDLSWMLMEMLRSVGLASRFVSGYAYNPELNEGHELHGWVEVFLPGAGWIGLDPSLGLMTDEYYISLATSFHPSHTLPIMGTYGGLAKAELFSEVNIIELD